jgi:DNA primase
MPEHRKPVDFEALKYAIPITAVLARYEVQLKGSGTWRSGKCPLPSHRDEPNADFRVNTEEGWFQCYSTGCQAQRGNRKGGDSAYFVSVMQGIEPYEAAVLLMEWFAVDCYAKKGVAQKQVEPPPTKEAEVNAPLGFALKGIDPKHPYAISRGFEEEECEFLGCGFFPGKGSMMGRFVFPIHDEKGVLIGNAGRSIDPDCPRDERWRFPKGFHRGVVLYNAHRCWMDSEIIVVESFWGALACVRAGILNVVALMSSTATDAQVEMLKRFEKITILLDGDKAGREGTDDLAVRLENSGAKLVEPKFLPDGSQPDHLAPEELRLLLGAIVEQDAVWEPIEEEEEEHPPAA